MEENKLVKFEGGALQKVGNAIAITNKLLQKNFDYLKWWNGLNEHWKKYFIACLKLEIARIKLRHALELMENRTNELNIIKLFENLDDNNFVMNIDSIKHLNKVKSIIVFNKCITDLEPLKLFFDLEKLEIRNEEIKSLRPLKELRNLKLFDCSKTHLSLEEIGKFKNEHPNCEVIA